MDAEGRDVGSRGCTRDEGLFVTPAPPAPRAVTGAAALDDAFCAASFAAAAAAAARSLARWRRLARWPEPDADSTRPLLLLLLVLARVPSPCVRLTC